MNRGEVWLLNLDPTVGAAIRKTRPVVIISSDAIGALPLRVIVPLTEWKEHYEGASWMVRIEPVPANGLSKRSAADAFQVRSVSMTRFVRQVGRLTQAELAAIVYALGLVIEAGI